MREVIKGFIYEAYNVFLYIAGAAITEEDLDEIRAAGGDKITFGSGAQSAASVNGSGLQ